jgi:outer membrane protein
MKSTMIQSLLAAAFLLGFASSSMALNEEIKFFNLDNVFNEFYKTKLADLQLKDQVGAARVESKKLVAAYEAINEEYKVVRESANNPIHDDEKRDQLRQKAEELLIQIRDQQSKIRRFEESTQKQVKDQGRRMRKRLVDEIINEVKIYAKDKGYTAVIDSSGQSLNGVALVVYVADTSDLTKDIIALLNKGNIGNADR